MIRVKPTANQKPHYYLNLYNSAVSDFNYRDVYDSDTKVFHAYFKLLKYFDIEELSHSDIIELFSSRHDDHLTVGGFLNSLSFLAAPKSDGR